MNLQDVRNLDGADPLAAKRHLFQLPADTIYLDGNSLGALSTAAKQRARVLVEQQWGEHLIQSWNRHHWIDLPSQAGEKIASLIGAAPGQTICCDSISVNLFKLLNNALNMQLNRSTILTCSENFPADLYIMQGLRRMAGATGFQLQAVSKDKLEQHITSDVAVLLLTHVDFKSAAMHDIASLTDLAHHKGIVVIWDLAHSAGAMPLALDDWQVDFAVGCGYKYLNGGPGAPAFIYSAHRHHSSIKQPLTGWMGHKAPFAFNQEYEAAIGIRQYLCGTPPVLSLGVLDAALDVFAGIDMQSVRHKSVALSELFLQLLQNKPALQQLTLESPTDSTLRGSHLAFSHPDAFAICQALIAHKVIADFRAPNILRLGFAPLYLKFEDIWDAVDILSDIMVSAEYTAEHYKRQSTVT